MLDYFSYCLKDIQDFPPDPQKLSKTEMLQYLSSRDTKPERIISSIPEWNQLASLIKELLVIEFLPEEIEDRRFSLISVWQWEQTITRHKKQWIQYSIDESTEIEKAYNSGQEKSNVSGILPLLAPKGHVITFDRETQIHKQINLSTSHTRNVRRTIKIKNMNYLNWLLCIHRTIKYIESFLHLENQLQEILSQLRGLIKKHNG